MGRLALIFGHTTGLGLAITEALLQEGEDVVGIARSQLPDGGRLHGEIRADLSLKDDLHSALEEIRGKYSGFSTLVYCAGNLVAHPIDEIDIATLDYVLRVNTIAPMVIESGLFDLIRDNPADVVNITSSSIIDYYPLFSEYSASKIALAKFSSDLQRSLRDSKARVVEFCPSGFASRLYERMDGVRVDRDESIQMPTDELARFLVGILRLPRSMEISSVVINRKQREP